MAGNDSEGKVSVQGEIGFKDNASKQIDKVTASLEKLGSETISVEDLLKNLAKTVKTSFDEVKASVSEIDNKTIEAMKELRASEMIDVNKTRSRAKSNLDNAKASEIKSRQKAGYYEAETAVKNAMAQHDDKVIQLAIEKNTNAQIKLTAAIEKTKQSENKILAAEKQLENTLVKKPYWEATAAWKSSSLFYDNQRSMMVARDLRNEKLRRALNGDVDEKSLSPKDAWRQGLSEIGGAAAGIKDPAGIAKTVGSVAQSFGKLLSASTKLSAGTFAAAELVNTAGKLFNEGIEAFQNVEVIKTNLGVISGSNIEGEKLFGDIAQYAIKSPFGVQQTAEQATLLRQSGVYAEDLMNTLKMVGDLAGGNADKMRRISNDYAQIVSNGKANMLQLRQFANAGVPIYKELSKELGVTNETVRKMVKNGEIGANTIEKVLTNLTSEGGVFYEAVEKGSKTLKARTTNLADARTLAFSELGRFFVNAGKGTGEESILMKMLGIQEKFFGWYYENQKRRNDEKELDRLDDKEKAYNKAAEDLNKALTGKQNNRNTYLDELNARNKLNELNYSIRSEDSQRILYNAYQNEMKDVFEKQEFIKEVQSQIDDVTERLKGPLNDITRSYLEGTLVQLQEDYQTFLQEMLSERGDIRGTYAQAASRAYFNNMYTSSSEILEKGGNKDKSLLKTTNDMLNLQKQTTEWKQKEVEEQRKLFESVKLTAIELSRLTNKVGDEDVLDLSKITDVAQFRKYSELLSQGDKFELDPFLYNVNNSSDKARANEVNTQFQNALANALRIALTAESDIKNTREFDNLFNQLSSLTDKHFLEQGRQFNTIYNGYTELLKSYADGSSQERQVAQLFKSVINPMISGSIIGNTSASNIDVSDILKTEAPLWARIIGSGLGLDATRVKGLGGGASIRLHEEEQFTRNITKSILGTGAKNGMNTYALMGMIQRTPGVYKSDLDGTRNLQINWKQTSQNFKKFALELGTAANVTSAYRETVENEMNSLADLLASMPTTFEDVKNSKSFTDQFLNVFTGELKWNGQTAYYDSQTKMITSMDGQTKAIYDVINQIEFAETTMQELTRQLEDRRKDLIEAKRAEATNSVFEEGKNSFREGVYGFIAEAMGFKVGSSQYKNFVKQGSISDVNQTWDSYSGWTESEREAVRKAEKNDADSAVAKQTALQKLLNTQALANTSESAIKKALNDDIINLAKKIIGEDFVGVIKEGEIKNIKPEQLEGYQEIKRKNDVYRKSIEDAKKSLAGLREEYDKLEVTTTAATVKQQQLADKLLNNSTSLQDVLRLSMQIYNDPALIKQDRDINDFQRYLNVKDTVSSLAFFNYGKRNIGQSGYFTDKFYESAYGLSKYDLDSVKMGREADIEAIFQTYGLNGPGMINDTLGNDMGSKLWAVYNGVGVGSDRWNQLIEEMTKGQLSTVQSETLMKGLQDNIFGSATDFGVNQFNDSLRTVGKSIREVVDGIEDGETAWKDFGKSFVEATKSLTANMGDMLISAGLSQLIRGETAIGIGLLLAGGMNQIVSGFLDPKDDNDTDKKIETLKALKSDLKELIAQAKADAIYYEKEVSHKKALTTSQSMTNVNDAIITPSGNVINTHPDDWLIATKTPQTLGNNKSSAPVVNLNIVNNSGQQLSVKKTQTTSNGEINIEAIIEGVVGKGIAEGKFDNALTTRDMRNAGRNVYM